MIEGEEREREEGDAVLYVRGYQQQRQPQQP